MLAPPLHASHVVRRFPFIAGVFVDGSLFSGERPCRSVRRIEAVAGRPVAEPDVYGMLYDGFSLSSAEDAAGQAAAASDVATLGLQAATDIVAEIQSKLIHARFPGVDRDVIDVEIAVLKQELFEVAQAASFDGENWLDTGGSPLVKSLVTPAQDSHGLSAIRTVQFDTRQILLISRQDADQGLLTRVYPGVTMNGSSFLYYLLDTPTLARTSLEASEIAISCTTEDDELDGMIVASGALLAELVEAGEKLRAAAGEMASGGDYFSGLRAMLETSVGRRIDADLQEEEAKSEAEKVQQELELSGLNIANDQSRTLLSLCQ